MQCQLYAGLPQHERNVARLSVSVCRWQGSVIFVEAVCDVSQKAGINQDKYCGHSLRIGTATMGAEKGVEDSLIKTLSR